MIKKKEIIIISVVLLVIVMSIIFFIKAHEMAHEKENRTNEEYISILLDNKEDFEYVAEIMQKYPSEYIYFSSDFAGTAVTKINDHFSCSSREIAVEILSDDEFYNHLMNLYNLDEIMYIKFAQYGKDSKGDIIMFYFEKFPRDYHGGIYYGTNIKSEIFTYIINENWALWMLPNV